MSRTGIPEWVVPACAAILLVTLAKPALAAPDIRRGPDGVILSVSDLAVEVGCTENRGIVTIRTVDVEAGVPTAFGYAGPRGAGNANLDLDWLPMESRAELSRWFGHILRPGAKLALGIKARGTGDPVELVDAIAAPGTRLESGNECPQ